MLQPTIFPATPKDPPKAAPIAPPPIAPILMALPTKFFLILLAYASCFIASASACFLNCSAFSFAIRILRSFSAVIAE